MESSLLEVCGRSSVGSMLISACLDGTLHVWKVDSNLARPNYSCETAHAKDTETTSVAFSRDGSRLVSRGGDGTIKCELSREQRTEAYSLVFDVKSMRRPVAVLENMENRYPDTNIIFSPDGRSILTGLPPAVKGEKGSLVFLNADTLEEQRKLAVGEGSVVRVTWHSRINQVCFMYPLNI